MLNELLLQSVFIIKWPGTYSCFSVFGARGGGYCRVIYSLEYVLCILQFWGRFVMPADS